MSTQAGIIASQTLLRYEKRMTISVIRAMSALAREINAGWSPEPLPMIVAALSRWRLTIQDLIFRFSEEAARAGVMHLLQAKGRKSNGLELVMMGIQYRLRNYSQQQATILENYLRARITRELTAGMSVSEARRVIRSVLNNRVAVDRIVRTTIHTSSERGMWEAANSLGVRVTKEWVSREDASVRPAHAAAHGQIREIDQAFTVGGEPMMFPGDPSASSRNRVNCRCTTNYRFG